MQGRTGERRVGNGNGRRDAGRLPGVPAHVEPDQAITRAAPPQGGQTSLLLL